MDPSEHFKTHGYAKIKLLSDDMCSYLRTSMDTYREYVYREHGKKWWSDKEEDALAFNDRQIPLSFSHYGVPTCEALLHYLKPQFEEILEKSLDPCYTYSRIYYHKAFMEAHKDRPSCEFSSTINLFGGEEWPIYITGYSGETSEVILQPGWGIVYNGTECEHWRNENPGSNVYQTFLHYVDANGPYRDFIFDKRQYIYFKN